MNETKPASQQRILEIELMKAVAIIGFLAPLLVIVTDIWVNIAIGFAVLVLSYFGGILLKKTNPIHV